MAIYRSVQMTFWTDSKVVDDFTPEDRYFYLYLLTNPHTNLCGCYEISIRQMSDETGYTKEVVERLLDRMENSHKVIRFSRITKELMIMNWSKFNWTTSKDFKKPLTKEINEIKDISFKEYLQNKIDGVETVPRPSKDGVGTTVTVTVTDTVTDTESVADKKETDPKHTYGEYKHVRLKDAEYQKLVTDYGHDMTESCITFLDEYIEMKGYKAKSHYLCIRKWVVDAVKEKEQRSNRNSGKTQGDRVNEFMLNYINSEDNDE